MFITEIVLAIVFLFGIKTKWFAWLALAQTIGIGLSVALAPHEWYWSYMLMGMVALTLMVMPSDRLSVDGWLARKRLKQ